jgi:L-asparaginase
MKKVVILGYGGTIATSFDPLTGTKDQAYTIREIIDRIGTLQNYELESKELRQVDSTELNQQHWSELAKATYKEIIRPDVSGVVITHGTDTMGYSAAALSFAIQNLGKPIVFTGSQKSIDEIITDASFNLVNSINLAQANLSGVYVCFGGLIIQGTRAVKTRSTSYQAFESINYPYISPMLLRSLFYMSDIEQATKQVEMTPSARNDDLKPKFYPEFSDRVFYMDMFPTMELTSLVNYLVEQNYLGLVIKGYGVGNIPSHLTSRLSEADVSFHTVLSTQCRYEGAEINSYALGVLAKNAGIISARDMPPETSFVKLKWLLAHYEHEFKLIPPFKREQIKEDMTRAIAQEIN